MKARFGPAGNGDKYYASGSRSVPEFLAGMGLTAYEYQCGRGVRLGERAAAELKEGAEKAGIAISVHAPYFISMSGVEREKRIKSVDYILQSAAAVTALGGDRVVVHTGSCGKISREEAFSLAADTLKLALSALDRENLGAVRLCPETMGKINQLGDLGEVIGLCKIDERLIPCVDFGHLNARTGGAVCGAAEYEEIFRTVENELGTWRARNMHIHFSKIEYTAGGEKKHLTFEDAVYGPPFEPLLDLIAKTNASPVIICESAGTQAEDAKTMMEYYEAAVNKNV